MSDHLNVRYIGELSGPLLAFGGPYSNLQACEALFAAAHRLGIPKTQMICTGDLVAYCGNPKETVDVMKDSGVHIIQGNCEVNLASDLDDCGCGFEEGSTCSVLSDHWYNYARSQVTAEQKAWMGSLPQRLEFDFAGKRFHVLHGSHAAISEFIFPSTDIKHKVAIVEEIGCDVVIAGHSGLPFTQTIADKAWHNPGVIGLPPNDGTPRVWYSLIQLAEDEVTFSHRVLDYDHHAAAKTMHDLSLNDYAHALTRGLYPSLSILPEKEKRETGKATQATKERLLCI